MKQKFEHFGALVAAVVLLQTIFFKFTGAEESRWIFSQLHAEPLGRIGSGIVEFIVAIGLLCPPSRAIASLGGVGVMLGALMTHFFVIGTDVQGDGGLLFGLALIVFVICVLISLNRRHNYLKYSEILRKFPLS